VVQMQHANQKDGIHRRKSCDRAISEMRGLSPKMISEDS
jgi:hypothetical protein